MMPMFRRPGATRHASKPRRRVVFGQATVEFAFTSLIFLTLVFGTIDFGRVAFTYSQLHNGVREGARVAKVKCGNESAIKNAVIDRSPTLGLTTGDITVTSVGACKPPTATVTVAATTQFTAITQNLLGIAPITLTATAKVDVE